jgi:hypothetical protein
MGGMIGKKLREIVLRAIQNNAEWGYLLDATERKM